ncbi:MAG: hypothetical protein IPO37_09770 [Saprospiraceae bacterium]|nr:hypothetical protein [Saprospiraceae bacterium]
MRWSSQYTNCLFDRFPHPSKPQSGSENCDVFTDSSEILDSMVCLKIQITNVKTPYFLVLAEGNIDIQAPIGN